MQAVRFEKDLHREMIDDWMDARQMARIPDWWLPTYGLIVEGVACGFLYVCDADVSMIETVLSSPEVTDAERAEALDLIAAGLCDMAKQVGSKAVIGMSGNRAILQRSMQHGFRVMAEPVHQMIKNL